MYCKYAMCDGNYITHNGNDYGGIAPATSVVVVYEGSAHDDEQALYNTHPPLSDEQRRSFYKDRDFVATPCCAYCAHELSFEAYKNDQPMELLHLVIYEDIEMQAPNLGVCGHESATY